VFADGMTPGMSGLELGEEIRRWHPDCPACSPVAKAMFWRNAAMRDSRCWRNPYPMEQLSQTLQKAAWRPVV
jgi:CheY-like chemotaxis protein